ncbi:MAG: hypothetical protein IPG58_00590 [Acidobacteria bacterium]|nr:hypothetical protein [Acidobacteriota bacterium]
MSEIGTLVNVFIEPENTFKDIVRKPRWIIAGIIISLLVGVYARAPNEGRRGWDAEFYRGAGQ